MSSVVDRIAVSRSVYVEIWRRKLKRKEKGFEVEGARTSVVVLSHTHFLITFCPYQGERCRRRSGFQSCL